jgi:hypothetical protein
MRNSADGRVGWERTSVERRLSAAALMCESEQPRRRPQSFSRIWSSTFHVVRTSGFGPGPNSDRPLSAVQASQAEPSITANRVPVIIVFIMAPFGASIGRRFPFADFDAGQARIESSLRRWKRSSAALSATDVHLDENFTPHGCRPIEGSCATNAGSRTKKSQS